MIIDGVDPGMTAKNPLAVATWRDGEFSAVEYVPPAGLKGMPRMNWLVSRAMGTNLYRNDLRLVICEDDAPAGHPNLELVKFRTLLEWEWARRGMSVQFLRPTSLKLIGAGHGRASKDQMIEAQEAIWGQPLTKDQADASAATAAGLELLGIERPWRMTDKQVACVKKNLKKPRNM